MDSELEKIETRKKDFIKSWDLIENFYMEYPDDKRHFNDDALRLISEMRKLNRDEELRARQSLWFFLLSRNRWHGLDNESHIKITFLGQNKMTIVSSVNGEKKLKTQLLNIKDTSKY